MHVADWWNEKQAPRGIDLDCPHLTGGLTRMSKRGLQLYNFSLHCQELETGKWVESWTTMQSLRFLDPLTIHVSKVF